MNRSALTVFYFSALLYGAFYSCKKEKDIIEEPIERGFVTVFYSTSKGLDENQGFTTRIDRLHHVESNRINGQAGGKIDYHAIGLGHVKFDAADKAGEFFVKKDSSYTLLYRNEKFQVINDGIDWNNSDTKYFRWFAEGGEPNYVVEVQKEDKYQPLSETVYTDIDSFYQNIRIKAKDSEIILYEDKVYLDINNNKHFTLGIYNGGNTNEFIILPYPHVYFYFTSL